MLKNMVQPDRPHDNIIRRMRFACRISNTAFPLQHWLRERAKMLRYTYIACIVIIYHLCLYDLGTTSFEHTKHRDNS